MNIIQTRNLTKSYGDFTAVSNLNLHVPKGSVYGFVGPNGAGKSTTMKMFLGLTRPTEGNFRIDGKTYPSDRVSILKEVGSFIEAPAFYGNLTGEENLDIIRRILGLPKSSVRDALELVGLSQFRKRLAKKYSLGMKQRLGLAGALIGRPPILILDEPTNGLDPAGIQEMRELISSLPRTFGITVLISSHLLSEIDQMATHVGIINQGELVFQDSLSVLHEHSRSRLLLRTSDDQKAFSYLKHSGLPAEWRNGSLTLRTLEDNRIMQAVSLLVNSGIGILRLQEQQMSLEDIFLHLTGKQVSL